MYIMSILHLFKHRFVKISVMLKLCKQSKKIYSSENRQKNFCIFKTNVALLYGGVFWSLSNIYDGIFLQAGIYFNKRFTQRHASA